MSGGVDYEPTGSSGVEKRIGSALGKSLSLMDLMMTEKRKSSVPTTRIADEHLYDLEVRNDAQLCIKDLYIEARVESTCCTSRTFVHRVPWWFQARVPGTRKHLRWQKAGEA